MARAQRIKGALEEVRKPAEGEPDEDDNAEYPKSIQPEQEITAPTSSLHSDDALADWCKRNDPDLTAQSCIDLKSRSVPGITALQLRRPVHPKHRTLGIGDRPWTSTGGQNQRCSAAQD
jgi:hypothetical protein